MKEKLKYYGAVASTVGVLIWAIYAWAGQITLTTYYPAPTGNYVNLTVTGNTYLATNSGSVGIGVTAPDSFFHVAKTNTNADTMVHFQNSGDGNATVSLKLGEGSPESQYLVLSNLGVDNSSRLYAIGPAGSAKLAFHTGLTTYTAGSTANERMTILDNGNIGIGNTNPGFTLTVNGTAWVTSGTWSGSDLRWKEHIAPLDEPLAKLLNLRGIKFDWKRKEFKANNFPEGRQIGMIAQEMEKEFPELVTTDKEGYKSIAYDRFTAVLLEGMKAQQKEIENLNKKVNALQDKLKNVPQ